MSFYKTGALAAVEKISIENWRKHVVASSVRQDPAQIETQSEFDIDADPCGQCVRALWLFPSWYAHIVSRWV